MPQEEDNIEALLFTLIANRLPMDQRGQSWKTWNTAPGTILCENGSKFWAYLRTETNQEALVILPAHLWTSVLLPQRQYVDSLAADRCTNNEMDSLLKEHSGAMLSDMISAQVKARTMVLA